jgi:hypothetical protein
LNVAPATAFVPADDYHEAVIEDASRFKSDVEGGSMALSLNWPLTTDHYRKEETHVTANIGYFRQPHKK